MGQVVKKQNNPRPSPSKFTVLRQLCDLIPSHLVPTLARDTGVDKVCRTFTAWSHVVTMLYAQLTRSIGFWHFFPNLALLLALSAFPMPNPTVKKLAPD